MVNDLKLLEKGLEMHLKGGILRVFGTLAITTADNLGSHEIGGFKLGFALDCTDIVVHKSDYGHEFTALSDQNCEHVFVLKGFVLN